MIGYIESFLIVVLEMLCCKIFYEIFAEKRRGKGAYRDIFLLITLILVPFFSVTLLNDYLIIKMIISLIEVSVIMYAFMKLTYVKSLILALLYDGLLYIVDYFCFLLSRTMFNEIVGIDDMASLPGVLLVVLGKTILFVVIIIVKKGVGNHTKAKLEDDEWLRMIIFPIFTICITSTMILVLGKPQMHNKDILFFIIAFGLSGMNIFVFYLINDILKREEKIHEDQLFRLQMKNQTEMYYSISENLEKQRQKTHEYKNKILCIESLMHKKKYEELESYLGNISAGLEKELDAITTNHVIVDAILNTKYSEMLEKNIIFVFKINNLGKIGMTDEDIVVILSNLLNNAIEACEKCDKKVIKLKFVSEEDGIVISVRNTYKNALIFQDGKYQTTKSETDNHGIGISNIINVVKRYQGSYVIKPDDEEFFFSIIIPNTDEKACN